MQFHGGRSGFTHSKSIGETETDALLDEGNKPNMFHHVRFRARSRSQASEVDEDVDASSRSHSRHGSHESSQACCVQAQSSVDCGLLASRSSTGSLGPGPQAWALGPGASRVRVLGPPSAPA